MRLQQQDEVFAKSINSNQDSFHVVRFCGEKKFHAKTQSKLRRKGIIQKLCGFAS